MKVRIFRSMQDALVEQGRLDRRDGFPRVHSPGEFSVMEPGVAFNHAVQVGARTEHASAVIPNGAGDEFAIPSDSPDGVDIDVELWRGPGRVLPRG